MNEDVTFLETKTKFSIKDLTKLRIRYTEIIKKHKVLSISKEIMMSLSEFQCHPLACFAYDFAKSNAFYQEFHVKKNDMTIQEKDADLKGLTFAQFIYVLNIFHFKQTIDEKRLFLKRMLVCPEMEKEVLDQMDVEILIRQLYGVKMIEQRISSIAHTVLYNIELSRSLEDTKNFKFKSGEITIDEFLNTLSDWDVKTALTIK